MAQSSIRWRRSAAGAIRGIGLLAVILLLPAYIHAQVHTAITPTSGAGNLGTQVTPVGNTYNITAGTLKGTNLFHSFGLFSVGTGDTANFTNTNGLSVTNILSRVTGGQTSNIDGTIQTTNFPGANLFLFNPSGVVFGPGASLNVGGSFHVSTAGYVKFADGAKFFANPSQASGLTTAPPTAFGFLGPTAAPISIQGSALQVPEGQMLSVVGGDVQITGATLTAPSGRIQIISVGSGGKVGLVDPTGAPTQDVSSFSRLGQIDISVGSVIDASDVSGIGGGTVVIRGGRLMVDASQISANTAGDIDGAPVGINIQLARETALPDGTPVGGSLSLTNGASVGTTASGLGRGGNVQLTASQIQIDGSSVTTSATGDGSGGNLSLSAQATILPDGTATGGTLDLANGASVATSTSGLGRGGDVQLFGHEHVTISGGASIVTQTAAGGRGGDVVIGAGSGPTEGTVQLSGGGLVFSVTGGRGRGGDVLLTAGRVAIDDAGIVTVSQSGEGVGGDVTVKGAVVALTDGAMIQSINGQNTTLAARGGNITVQAADSVSISGQNASGVSSQIFSSTDTAGDGGRILVSAQSLAMESGTTISSVASFGEGSPGGAGGAIVIDVGHLSLTGGATLHSVNNGPTGTPAPGASFLGGNVTVSARGEADISGESSEISSAGFGAPPGDIAVQVGTLRLTDKAVIQGGNPADPTSQAGSVTVGARDSILIANGAGISSQALNSDLGPVAVTAKNLTIDGGFINTGTFGAGRAGDISIDVGTLTLTRGGQIASSSIDNSGPGGNVTIRATDSVAISGSASESVLPKPFSDFIKETASGIFSTAPKFNPSASAAGSIAVSTQTLNLSDGGKMSVATEGAGAAGAITLTTTSAASSVAISGAGSGLFSTTKGSGDAGQITVTTPTLSLSDGSTISVATGGAGNAGDIGLIANSFSLTGGARVDSSTTGSGKGGTVTVNAVGAGTISSGGGLFSNAEGTGAGGDLIIQAAQLQLLDGATISAKSSGTDTALAGNVSIDAGSLLRMANSTITTQAAVADGGNISITTTGSLVHLTDSQITTSVQSGVGRGGNITIGSKGHPSEFILLNSSQVRADAFGGPGGNINVNADTFLTSDSLVSASSALSTPGTINIQASVTDVSGRLVQLPAGTLEAAALLRASCAARLAGGKSSSLVLAGRDGLPLDPAGLLPSPLVVERPAAAALSLDEGYPWLEKLLRVSELSLDPKCSR